ncbi:KHDC1-like protein [Callorhinus ursinus]|uniref:KHDC1-like protein n=1 Tax=Callorhinus ursinus TaxID=34884 RepID=UPI003CD01C36
MGDGGEVERRNEKMGTLWTSSPALCQALLQEIHNRLPGLPPPASVGAIQDMERRPCSEKPWCTVSENFYLPLVFYMEADQEERIFGHLDADLHCLEVHSHTLIQLESWFTAASHTRVPVVGPPEARRWLFGLI